MAVQIEYVTGGENSLCKGPVAGGSTFSEKRQQELKQQRALVEDSAGMMEKARPGRTSKGTFSKFYFSHTQWRSVLSREE